jgi:hypothetical protein
MIWGEVVNAVRSLHLEMMDQFQIQPRTYAQDIELIGARDITFPDSSENFEEWDWPEIPPGIQEALELHPVERALLEGPLLPIESVKIIDEAHLESLLQTVIALEKEWLEKARIHSPEKFLFIEQSLKLKWLKLQTRAGLKRLKAV